MTDEQILQDMRIAAQASPRGALSEARYAQVGRYDSKTPTHRFGSWNAALRLALPDVYARRHPSPEEMIADLHRVAAICRKKIQAQLDANVPWGENDVRTYSQLFYNQYGKYTWTYISYHLGREHLQVESWPKLLAALGIDVTAIRYPSPEEMMADLHRVADICRVARLNEPTVVRSLSKKFYDKHGRYTWHLLMRRLGKAHFHVETWIGMKEAAGIDDV